MPRHETPEHESSVAFIRELSGKLASLPADEFLFSEANSDMIDSEVETYLEKFDRQGLYAVLESLPKFASLSMTILKPKIREAAKANDVDGGNNYPHSLSLAYQNLITDAFCVGISLRLQTLDETPKPVTAGVAMMMRRQTTEKALKILDPEDLPTS